MKSSSTSLGFLLLGFLRAKVYAGELVVFPSRNCDFHSGIVNGGGIRLSSNSNSGCTRLSDVATYAPTMFSAFVNDNVGSVCQVHLYSDTNCEVLDKTVHSFAKSCDCFTSSLGYRSYSTVCQEAPIWPRDIDVAERQVCGADLTLVNGVSVFEPLHTEHLDPFNPNTSPLDFGGETAFVRDVQFAGVGAGKRINTVNADALRITYQVFEAAFLDSATRMDYTIKPELVHDINYFVRLESPSFTGSSGHRRQLTIDEVIQRIGRTAFASIIVEAVHRMSASGYTNTQFEIRLRGERNQTVMRVELGRTA